MVGPNGQGTVVSDGFNIVGHDGSAGVAGFAVGATEVPTQPLAAILDLTLGYNRGPTPTHALVFGSPAVDRVPGTACAAARPQDGDGDTDADCDSGAVERGQVPVQAELARTRLDCRGSRCEIPVTCNLTEAQCTNKVVVRTRVLRAADGTVTRAARQIRFAAGVTQRPARRDRAGDAHPHQAGQATRPSDHEEAPEGRVPDPRDRRHRKQYAGHQQDGRHDPAQAPVTKARGAVPLDFSQPMSRTTS